MKKRFFPIALVFLFSITTVLALDETQNVTVTIVPNKSLIVINEFVADPQTDWDNDTNTNSNDEWFELFNKDTTAVNLSGWELTEGAGSSTPLSGFIQPNGFVVFINPSGALNNGGDLLNLTDQFGRQIDVVAYGNWDDGNVFDNAPVGTSNDIFDECIARFPNGIDTDNDKLDFIKTQCTFNSTNNLIGNVTFIPISIINLPSSLPCVLETNNLTIQANITGSIKTITLALNTDGTWQNISLPTNGEIFTHQINSSQLSGNTNVSWQFIVQDILDILIFGDLQTQHINSITTLSVNPINPDGIPPWYVSPPRVHTNKPRRSLLFLPLGLNWKH